MPVENFDDQNRGSTAQKAPEATGRDDWTLVVDLGLVVKEKGPNGNLGSEETLHQLALDLAPMPTQKTFNGQTPVRLYVGALVPHDATKAANNSGQSSDAYDFEVLQLQDRQLKVLAKAPTHGLEADLKTLTGYAAPRFKSEKMGLVINAHSNFSDGYFDGGQDGRPVSELAPERLQAIVHDWLNHDPLGFSTVVSGNKKLDLLDEDMCFGGKLANLNITSASADNLVANELIMHEGAFAEKDGAPVTGVLNGQNIGAIYRDILMHPGESGSLIADRIVDDAKAGGNDFTMMGLTYSAATTLGHYDLGAPRIHLLQSLDHLGDALTANLAKNAGAIGAAIDATPDLWRDENIDMQNPPEFARRDLQTFLNHLKENIAAHKIDDGDGAIAASIGEVEAARKGLIKNWHAQKGPDNWPHLEIFDPEKLGDLSISLPDQAVRNNKSLTAAQYDASVGSDTTAGAAPQWHKFLTALRASR